LAAVSYPAIAGTYPPGDVRQALQDVYLDKFVDELDREDAWSQRLSSGEQQRLALARAFLMRPDWLLLDESTSGVDETMEAQLYQALARQLPQTTIVSIGHRSSVIKLHQRHLQITPCDGICTIQDVDPSVLR
jgi:putative ATP-binding cassette transporter